MILFWKCFHKIILDRSPSNMKNLLYQMALAVQQFHNGSKF